MSYEFTLSVGDPSGDGHEKHDEFRIRCTHPINRVYDAHLKAVRPYPILKSAWSKYRDREVTQPILDAFTAAGVVVEGLGCDLGEWMEPHMLAELYLQLAQTKLPKLQWEHVEEDILYIGGYGLYGE